MNEVWDQLDDREYIGTLFHPRPAGGPAPAEARDYKIPVGDGVELGARWHRFFPDRPTILFFHGNGEVVSDYDDIAPVYREIGLNFFVVDFRGYGWSGGRPSLRGLKEDGPRVADFFLEQIAAETEPPTPYIMGRSLGSAPACEIACSHGEYFAGLILESAFASVLPLLELMGIALIVPDAEVEDLFSNHLKLKRIQLPVLILHGDQDNLIPPEHAHDNYAHVGHDRKSLRIIPAAGHNDMLLFGDYFGAIQDFVGA